MIDYEQDRVESVTQADTAKTLSDKVIELKDLEDIGLNLKEWDLDFSFEQDEPTVEIVEPETNQKTERFKQLTFLYEDVNKYADHFKRKAMVGSIIYRHHSFCRPSLFFY